MALSRLGSGGSDSEVAFSGPGFRGWGRAAEPGTQVEWPSLGTAVASPGLGKDGLRMGFGGSRKVLAFT